VIGVFIVLTKETLPSEAAWACGAATAISSAAVVA